MVAKKMMSGASGNECAPAPRNDKKEQTPLSLMLVQAHPLEDFTAVLSVFQAHLPVHAARACKASGLEKPGARNRVTRQDGALSQP